MSECGCTHDAELGAGGVCPACGHRDHDPAQPVIRLLDEWPDEG